MVEFSCRHFQLHPIKNLLANGRLGENLHSDYLVFCPGHLDAIGFTGLADPLVSSPLIDNPPSGVNGVFENHPNSCLIDSRETGELTVVVNSSLIEQGEEVLHAGNIRRVSPLCRGPVEGDA